MYLSARYCSYIEYEHIEQQQPATADIRDFIR